MKKVLYAASTAGHLQAFHLFWLHWLRQAGWTVHAAAAGAFSCEDVTEYFDLPFTKSMFSLRNLSVSRQIQKLQRREHYDLICVHTSLAAFFVRLGLFGCKKNTRVINVVHGYLFDSRTALLRRTILLCAERLTAPLTDEIAVMNRQDLQIARRYRLCRGQITMLPGIGVDFSRFALPSAEDRRAARDALGLPPEAFLLIYAAEFSARKNQSFLVRALARAPEHIVLLLPGQGAEQQRVRELAEELGLKGRVLMPGFVSNMPELYHAADLCVSASRSEGLPFNLMEAMACGLCCLASCVKGHEDLIEPGKTGMLYTFDDRSAFLQSLSHLMNTPEETRRMGLAARSRVLTHYGLEQAAPVYTALLDPRRPEPAQEAET